MYEAAFTGPGVPEKWKLKLNDRSLKDIDIRVNTHLQTQTCIGVYMYICI